MDGPAVLNLESTMLLQSNDSTDFPPERLTHQAVGNPRKQLWLTMDYFLGNVSSWCIYRMEGANRRGRRTAIRRYILSTGGTRHPVCSWFCRRCWFYLLWFYTVLREAAKILYDFSITSGLTHAHTLIIRGMARKSDQSCLAGASSILPTIASIFAMTSGVNLSRTCSDLTFSTICWGFDAPVMTEETCSFLRHQASASWDCVTPSWSAIG